MVTTARTSGGKFCCDEPTSSSTSGQKGRALVTYMVSGEWKSEHGNRQAEFPNLEYFLHFGYIPPNVSTKLFSGVDYVFFRRADVTETTEMPKTCDRSSVADPALPGGQGYVRIMLVPMSTRCDICGHVKA